MKTLRNKTLRSKTTAVGVTLVLLLAIVASLVVMPFVNAQTWSISIQFTASSGLVRCEIWLDGVRNQSSYGNITLAVMYPGNTYWSYLGPYSTTNGRYDYTFTNWTNNGWYQFQYIVPPQGALPTNPATTDGKWYSDIVSFEALATVMCTVTPSTGLVSGEVRFNNVRRQTTFSNITLRVQTPGNTTWTNFGPYSSTSTGIINRYYSFAAGTGNYTFQYIVPPQDGLAYNTETSDGKWYSNMTGGIYGWSIYSGITTSWVVRGEVQYNQTYQTGQQFKDLTLAFKAPGDTTWTYITGIATLPTSGRVDYYFGGPAGTWTTEGTYTFQWIVPPQLNLTTNPATSDGKWYSDTVQLNWTKVTYKTYCFVGCVPNPVGVGQPTLIACGITQQLSDYTMSWFGITVTVTKPDNTTETLGPVKTDSTGATGLNFYPTVAGNYTLISHFPEQNNYQQRRSSSGSAGTVMNASDSLPFTLVVTDEPRPYYPNFALPTEYWTRPIDAQIREWGYIAGSSFYPSSEYQDAPESAHVLWAKRLGVEGLIGGASDALTTGLTATKQFILGGVLLYNRDPIDTVSEYYTKEVNASQPSAVTIAVDVRTGEELYRQNVSFNFLQIYNHISFDRMGCYPWAWSIDPNRNTTYSAYDPWTGAWAWNITNFPNYCTMSMGEIGEILCYNYSLVDQFMYVWNSSWLYMQGTTAMTESYNVWRTTQNGAVRGWQFNNTDADGKYFHMENVGPIGYPMGNISLPSGLTGSIVKVNWGHEAIGVDITDTTTRVWAFSLVRGKEGELLYDYKVNYAAPSVNPATTAGPIYVEGPVEDFVQLRYQAATMKYWAYSLKTGALLWSSENFDETKDGEHYLNHYSRDEKADYGMLFTTGRSGITYAYNFTTGLVWTHAAWGTNPQVDMTTKYASGIALMSDGKIYVSNGEPANVESVPRGAPFICLNATTGEEIWRANGMFRQSELGVCTIIGDSVIVMPNSYDQRVYAIGKGPSATTVSATAVSVPYNSPVMVKGTVMDVSPGTYDSGLGTYATKADMTGVNKTTWDSAMKLRFPNGVPAVSDESMSEWMKFVYKNLPRPADVKGVEVVISVFDSNNNYYPVGTTTSDGSGAFSFTFVPPNPGKYIVFAQFEGSNSYFGSTAETSILVEEPPVATPAPTPTPVPMSEAYFVPAITGIIVAIVAMGILLALLLLRKH
jgi:hypothetical protein